MSSRQSEPATITKSDIAELAGVGRSTVSNWIARHSDFPTPVDDDATSPRFATEEIRGWLRSKNKPVRELSSDRTLWSLVDSWRGAATLSELGSAVSTLIALRYAIDPDAPGFEPRTPSRLTWPALCSAGDDVPGRVRSAIDAHVSIRPDRASAFDVGTALAPLEQSPGLAMELISALSQVPAESLAVLFDAFQNRLTSSGHRGYDQYASSDALVALVAGVAASVPGPVHDPAVGSGRMLIAVGQRGAGRHRLTGQDISRAACLQAAQRALVSGLPGVTIEMGDVLTTDRFGRSDAGVVVVDPPYGVGRSDAVSLGLDQRLRFGAPTPSNVDVAWLQIAVWHLAPGGRAFVLQPRGTAVRGGAARRVREAMLKAGTVEAVVALPPNLAWHTSIPLHLWILARDNESADPSRVLLVDESEATQLDVSAVAAALTAWRDHRDVAARASAVQVSEIIASESDLSPERWNESITAPPAVEQVRRSLDEVRRGLDRFEQLSRQLDSKRIVEVSERAPTRTLSELAKATALTVLRARPTNVKDVQADDGTPIVSGTWVRFGREDRRVNLGLLDHEPVITRPGDVVVQIAGDLAARVDLDGGRVLLSASYVLLRPDLQFLDPEYLASALVTQSNASTARGTTIPRFRVQELKIVYPTVDAQRSIASETRTLREIQVAATAVAELAAKARSDLIESVDRQVAGVVVQK